MQKAVTNVTSMILLEKKKKGLLKAFDTYKNFRRASKDLLWQKNGCISSSKIYHVQDDECMKPLIPRILDKYHYKEKKNHQMAHVVERKSEKKKNQE